MFKKAGKKTSKVLAYLLALMVMVGYVPAELLVTAMAADTVNYTITVTDGSNPIKGGVSVEITNLTDFEVETVTTDAETGIAQIELIDGRKYIFDASIEGYIDDPSIEGITVDGTAPNLTIVMTKLDEVEVTGVITDELGEPYTDAEVIFTRNGFNKSVITNNSGEYSLTCYKESAIDYTYNIQVKPNSSDANKYAVITGEFKTDATPTVDLQFELKEYAIKSNKTGAGTVSFYEDEDATQGIADLTSVPYGTEVTVKVEADEDYRIKSDSFSVTGEGITNAELDNDNKFTFIVKSDVSVSVEFEKYVFDLTIDANFENEKGSIKFYKGNDEITTGKANKGDVITVKVDAKDAYLVKSMTINSALYKNSSEKEVTVTEDLIVTANFEAKVFEVEFFVTGKGTIEFTDDNDTIAGVVDVVETPQGKVDEIGYNGELVFNVIANSGEGYHIESIESSSDNMVIDNTNDITIIGENDCIEKNVRISEITANQTVTVKFAINTYTVAGVINNTDVTSNDDGSIVVNNGSSFNYGDDVTVTITPKANKKQINSLTLNGNTIDFENDDNFKLSDDGKKYIYTIKNITSDCNLNVVFGDIDTVGSVSECLELYVDSGSLLTSESDTNNNKYVYSNGTQISLKAKEFDNVAYNQTDYYIDGEKEYVGWKKNGSKERKITSNLCITSIQMRRGENGQTKEIDLKGKPLQIIIDNEAPEVTLNTPNMVIENDNVTVKFDVTDTYTSIKKVIYSTADNYANITVDNSWDAVAEGNDEYSFTLTEEQNETYYIYATDTAGNVSDAQMVNVVIDKNQPTVSDVVSSAQGKPTNKDVTISFTADDTNEDATLISGLDRVVYTTDENLEKDEILALTTTVTLAADEYSFKVTNTANKNTTYYIYAIDKAGNISEKSSIEVWITTVSPVVESLTKNPNFEWSNKEVTISGSVNIQENGSNINRVVYTTTENLEEDKILALTATATLADGKYSFTVNDAQNQKYYIYAIDEANNVSDAESIDVKIDTTAPVVTGFDFKPNNDNAIGKAINFLSFGMFFKDTITITASVEDKGDYHYQSGCDRVVFELCEDGKTPVEENAEVVDGKASIEISATFKGVVKATVYDKAGTGNASDKILATSANSSDSGLIMVEQNKPEISFEETTPVANSMNWYNKKDITIPFTVNDIDGEKVNSGIYSIEVKAFYNQEETTPFATKAFNTGLGISDSETVKNTITVPMTLGTNESDDFKYQGDGKYKFEVTVTDNAGNVETSTTELLFDTTAPEVTRFQFVGEDEEITVKGIQVVEYGFYFKENTTLKVYLDDVVDGVKDISNIEKVCYYTVDYTKPDSPVTSDVFTSVDPVLEGKEVKITYDAENNVAQIPINAGFKGQIYVWVTDNAGNDSTKAYDGTDVEPVKPSDSVVESKEQHDAAEKHIVFSVSETSVATENGSALYKDNVPVVITIADAFAGIEKIEWSVVAPNDTEANFSDEITIENTIEEEKGEMYKEWDILEKDFNIITKMSKTIYVDNNSNDIKVIVTMTDRAGNTTTDDISFSIDKTAPVIEVTYDNNTPDAEYDSFYKANRTATITITERNFNPDDVKIVIENTDNVIPKLSNWTKTAVEDGIHPDGTVYTAKIDYVADGDYTFDIDYSDRATNVAKYVVGNTEEKADDFTPHAFTIDKTRPVVKVTYDNNKALNKNYYAAERTATITVTEHNFKYIDENGKESVRVNVNGKATDNGKKVTFPAIKGWTSNGDVHTATISYKADAKYIFDIEILDLAGNSIKDYKQEEFYIDKTAPEVEITGVANNSANNGKVAPVVNYTDTNFTEDGVTVTLTGVNRGRVDYSRGVAKVANGQTMSYENFRNVKEVDDIYTLTAKVVDKAGNETTKTISFSVNRFGSTYNLEAVKSYNNKYIQSMGDLVFTEVNVNSLDLGNIRVKLTKNGTPSDLVINKDFTVDVAGGGGRWYTYTYTIKSALFQDDAKYSLSFYSVDASGNVNENIDETKEAVVSFAVDKTKPVIIPIDLAEGERYKETVKNVTIEVKDNLLLEDVKIYLNDSEVEYTVEGESYTIQVPESTERQTIKIVAVDAAGNEYETVVKDFLVSTNAFVQFVNNTPVFIGSIVALVVVIGAIIAFIILGKKKRRK